MESILGCVSIGTGWASGVACMVVGIGDGVDTGHGSSSAVLVDEGGAVV